MTKAAVCRRLRVWASPKASPSSTKASACSPFCPRFEWGRCSAGPSVAKAMAAATPVVNCLSERFPYAHTVHEALADLHGIAAGGTCARLIVDADADQRGAGGRHRFFDQAL